MTLIIGTPSHMRAASLALDHLGLGPTMSVPHEPVTTLQPDALADLAELGLLERTAGDWLPVVKLMKVENLWIATDWPEYPHADAVFPLHPECLYFARMIHCNAGDQVLDLCTGSGILALVAAQRGAQVTAVDINQRALEFARFNAALNDLEGRVEWRLGDLFGPVHGQSFDSVISNPPFEPVPPGYPYFLHSDGGPDGLSAIRRVLEDVKEHLRTPGRLQMVAFSLGTGPDLLLTQLIRQIGLDREMQCHLDILTSPLAVAEFSQRFSEADTFRPWLDGCLSSSKDQLYYAFLTCDPGATPGMNVTTSYCENGVSWHVPLGVHGCPLR